MDTGDPNSPWLRVPYEKDFSGSSSSSAVAVIPPPYTLCGCPPRFLMICFNFCRVRGDPLSRLRHRHHRLGDIVTREAVPLVQALVERALEHLVGDGNRR